MLSWSMAISNYKNYSEICSVVKDLIAYVVVVFSSHFSTNWITMHLNKKEEYESNR